MAAETPGRLSHAAESARRGLSSEEVAARRRKFGPNEVLPRRRETVGRQVLAQLRNPLVAILLVASGLAFGLGEFFEAGLIVLMVLLSVALNVAQTYRSTRAAVALRDTVAARAMALRDGRWVDVLARDLVPGDLVRLSAGDLVPADARLLEARDLHIHEAAMTGESLPVEKTAADGSGPDTLFLGTSVVSGSALAVVTATGRSTAFAEVVAKLAARPPETAFERGMRGFGVLILRTVVFLVLFTLAVNLALRRPALESLLFTAALAVGLTPEFLPMITTVTLSSGAVRLARKKVIVKHLAALQNLGAIDILCSDKTGTLTAGRMTLEVAVDGFGTASQRVRELAYINSALQTGIRSPLDAAILEGPAVDVAACRKLDEIPFDFERRRLSVVVDYGPRTLMIAKGAPEGVLPLCVDGEEDGTRAALDAERRARCENVCREFFATGRRVLALAVREVGGQPAYGPSDETGMTLVGFLVFSDPLREDAAETIAALRRDGVAIKIVTGDNELVARHVCAQVGIDASRLVLGEELLRTSDAALGPVVEEAEIFARVSPGQKNRILLALKARGHAVGFLGDGINDAPSLRAADVGISVAGGVEVAREAAEIILLEPGLAVLHTGILEGRKAFGNVMKYLLMGTSSNFGNMVSMAAASLFLPFLPMLATQILLNNFLYDLAQVSIPTDRVDAGYIAGPQHWDIRLVRNFMVGIGPISSVFDGLTFWALLKVFRADEVLFHTGWFVESLATQALVLFVIRTAGNPWKSRPSGPLAATTLGVVAVAVLLPYTPLATPLGFRPLPAGFGPFLCVTTGAYLVVVDRVKRRLLRPVLGRAR